MLRRMATRLKATSVLDWNIIFAKEKKSPG